MKKWKGKIFIPFLAVLLVSLLACENPFLKKMLVEEESANSAVPVPKHTVSFSVEGGLGTLKAKADGIAETETSPISVEQGKTATFTAEPAADYVIKEWKVDGIVTGNTSNSYTHTVTAAVDVKVSFEAPFVEGGASLILSPDKLTIKVKAKTEDGSNIVVEGCTETTLANDTETELHAQGTTVILKGKIIELYCGDYYSNGIRNKLTALNVQGLNALQVLSCNYNRLTALDVHGLNNLQVLYCSYNKLTALNVQGCTALTELYCRHNQLTSLNVQGLSVLQNLNCENNQLTTLNVQDCTALQRLYCYNNQLTAEAFTQIFNDLPTRTAGDGAGCILYTEEPGVTEGNCTDFTTPDELKTAFQNAKNVKHWKMKKVNTSGNWEEI